MMMCFALPQPGPPCFLASWACACSPNIEPSDRPSTPEPPTRRMSRRVIPCLHPSLGASFGKTIIGRLLQSSQGYYPYLQYSVPGTQNWVRGALHQRPSLVLPRLRLSVEKERGTIDQRPAEVLGRRQPLVAALLRALIGVRPQLGERRIERHRLAHQRQRRLQLLQVRVDRQRLLRVGHRLLLLLEIGIRQLEEPGQVLLLGVGPLVGLDRDDRPQLVGQTQAEVLDRD